MHIGYFFDGEKIDMEGGKFFFNTDQAVEKCAFGIT